MNEYRVVVAPEAREFYEEASASLQRRLDRCFRQLAVEPRRHPNIKFLRGQFQGYLRYRMGDYRIIYWIDESQSTVKVVAIANRREAYD